MTLLAVEIPHVWPRPPLLRRQRDQGRVPDSAGAAGAEFRAELERGAPGFRRGRLIPLPVVRYDAKDHQRSLEVMRRGLIPFWANNEKIGFVHYEESSIT
jgi:hypothetical protein